MDMKRSRSMGTQQLILLIINILGGAAVIGSYIYGLKGQAGGANVLWGNVAGNIRPVYTVSMILSALGYFAFIYFVLFRINPSESNVNYYLFYGIFVVILGASAFWMPLTNMYVSNPGTGLWLGVRVVLALVALGSIALVWALVALHPDTRGVAYWLAVAGAGYFAFHTTVLDAIVWAALFK
jgi:hypothetical protein